MSAPWSNAIALAARACGRVLAAIALAVSAEFAEPAHALSQETTPQDSAVAAPDSSSAIVSPSDSAQILIGSPDTLAARDDSIRVEEPPAPLFDPYARGERPLDSDRVYTRAGGVRSGSRTPLEPLRELRGVSLERFGYLGQSERLMIAGDENVALAIAGAPLLPSRSGLPPYEVLPTEALIAARVRDPGGNPFLGGRGSAGSLEWDVGPRLRAEEDPATTAFAERGPFDFRAYRASFDRRIGPVRGNVAYQAAQNRLFGSQNFARARGSYLALTSEERWRVPVFLFASGTRQELDLSLSAREDASGRGTEERSLVIARTEIAVPGVRRAGVVLKHDRLAWRASDAAALRGHERESGGAITLGEGRTLSLGAWGYAGRVVDERGARSRGAERAGAVVRARGGFGESARRHSEPAVSDTVEARPDTMGAVERDASAAAMGEETGVPAASSGGEAPPIAGAHDAEPDHRWRWDLNGGGERVSPSPAREHLGASLSGEIGPLRTILSAARAHDHPPRGLLLPDAALAPARKTTAALTARSTIAEAHVSASVLHRWARDAIFLSASDPFYADILRESYEEWAGVFEAALPLPLRVRARGEYQFTRDDAALPLPLRAEHRGRLRLERDFPLARPDAVLSLGATLEAAGERFAFDRVTRIPESIDLRANVRIAAAGAVFFMQAENLLDRCNYVLPYDANDLSLGCDGVALGVLPEGRSYNFGVSWVLRN